MAAVPPISFSGLASGIDTSSVIAQMVKIEQIPVTQIQNTESGYNTALTTWQTFNTQLSALQASANALTQPSAFNAASATSSDATVASITSQTGAVVGSHVLTVSQLAQSQKLVSNSFTSSNAALSQTGSFVLNGKVITLASSDALSDVSAKINSSGAGVTASVVNVGAGDYRLTLTSNATGAANTISLSDLASGTISHTLGLISSSAPGIRESITPDAAHAGAASLGLSSATQSIAITLGIPSGTGTSGIVHIAGTTGGANISINFSTDSLNDIANKINAASVSGVTAQVVSLTDANGNAAKQQLQILSSNTTTSGGVITAVPPTFTDSNNVLATLGVLQSSFTNPPISTAQDAKFNLDGLDFTRSSNAVNDALMGANITLLKAGTPAGAGPPATAAVPATTNLSIVQDTTTPVTLVNAFVTAYNAIQDFITQQNQFTAPTSATGASTSSPPLFGSSTLTQIQSELSHALGVASGSSTLETIGITSNAAGDLQVNTTTLTSALQNNPSQVANLFALTGTSDNPNVQYVNASGKTQASTGPGFNVNITQAASQTRTLAADKQSAVSTVPETLTFAGTLFSSPVSLTLPTGNALQDTVNQINRDSSLNSQIYASIDPATGGLVIASQGYGATTGFSVISDTAVNSSSHNTSGIGKTGGSLVASTTYGKDVAGTINGEPATGTGRTLTGNSGNATTEGIQLLVTGGASGKLGHVGITHGAADSISAALTQILDPINGSVIGAENAINTQITDAQDQITQLNAQVSAYQDFLTQEFSAMETRVSQLQSQGAAFAAQIAAATGASSSSSSSSTKKTN